MTATSSEGLVQARVFAGELMRAPGSSGTRDPIRNRSCSPPSERARDRLSRMSDRPERPGLTPGWSRRGFLYAGAAGAAAAALPASRRRLLQMSGYPIDAETPLDSLTSYITPNDIFFVRHHWTPVFPDPTQWLLQVDGEVEHPLRLSLADLWKM